METKRERFRRIAENRTNKIISMIELLGNCANKGNYEYSKTDVKNIFEAIERVTKDTKQKFINKEEKNRFKL